MNPILKYSVRLITEEEQLTEALSLRYKTYKKAYPKFVENTTHPFESDAFDTRSLHLGLYCDDGLENSLAGYCRLILPESFENDYSYLLINQHPEYNIVSQNSSKEKLAFIKDLINNNYNKINSFCDSLEKNKIVYSETSRFIVDEKHRSISLCSFFVSSLFAVCESLNIKYNFFTCSAHHAPFYSKSGLTLLADIEPFDKEFFGTDSVVFGTDLRLANAKQASITSLKLEFEEKSSIVFRRAA